jgi:AcrR family transcriptional regulator
MPKIRASTIERHHELVWANLIRGLEQLLATKSYDEISVSEIAAAAGIARNTVYNYAPDKAALVALAAERCNQGLLDAVREIAELSLPAAERLASILNAVIQWYAHADHRPLLVQTLFRPVPGEVHNRAGAPLEQTGIVVARVLSDGIQAGEFRSVGDVPLVVDLLAGIVTRAAIRVVEAPQDVDAISGEVVRFSMRALAPSG